MKNVLRTAVASVAVASVAISAPAFAATETVDARAEIIAALDIQLLDNTRDSLDFGAGLVCNGPFETPLFTLDGEANAVVNLSITDTTIDLTDGTNTMAVALTLGSNSETLDGTGTATFEVGGTLTVAADQPVGVYNDQGDFVVVAVYN